MEKQAILVEPTERLKAQYLEFYEEWAASGEDFVPWVIGMDPSDFPGMLQVLRNNADGVNIPAGFVASSTYWLVTPEEKVVGAVNIRHQLTERLRNSGGHIGYGIVPSGRRKGYAKLMLKLALGRAKDLGIPQALVVCDEGNTGSERTIRANGGVPEEPFIEPDGNVILRFWIET